MQTLNAIIKGLDLRQAIDKVKGQSHLVPLNPAGRFYIKHIVDVNGEPEPLKKKKKKTKH